MTLPQPLAFREILLTRARELSGATLLVSGGSASALAMRSFAEAGAEVQLSYIQFRNFDWPERELLKNEVAALSQKLRTIEFNEIDWMKSQSDWASLSTREKEARLWTSVLEIMKRDATIVTGHGLALFRRTSNTVAPLDSPMKTDQTDGPALAFFDERTCAEFENSAVMQLFFELAPLVPFETSRYWQDFAIKAVFKDHVERPEWKWSDVLWDFA